jgi:D-sedoheptulose 7-phosphate isomerase
LFFVVKRIYLGIVDMRDAIYNIQTAEMTLASNYQKFVEQLTDCLQSTVVADAKGQVQLLHDGLSAWEAKALDVQAADGTVFFIGNGASNTMASHFATDIGKNAGFRCQVFSDASLMTALGNDLAFDRIFSEPLARLSRPGDMLVAISSSGNSPNILKAAETAIENRLWLITLSGLKPGNRLRSLGHFNFWVPANTYGLVETAHSAILHYWTDQLVARNGADDHHG